MIITAADLGTAGYGAAAVAYMVLAALLLFGRPPTRAARWFAGAALTTSVATGVTALGFATGWPALVIPVHTLETLRAIAWLAFLWTLWQPALPSHLAHGWGRFTVIVTVLLLAAVSAARPYVFGAASVASPVDKLLAITFGVAGMLVLENLMRRADLDYRWQIKFLAIGLGGLFVYDLYFHAEALLAQGYSQPLAVARGAIYALVVPLLFIAAKRSAMWQMPIALSQKSALYSTTLIASGIYLVLMAIAAWMIRHFGGASGTIFQIVFLFGGAIVLGTIMASGAFRAHVRVLVAKHFFAYKYDYREVWMQFTRTMSYEDGTAPLGQRAIRAIADILDSPGGALWLRQPHRFAVAATWNMPAASFGDEEAASLTAFLAEKEWIIDLGEETQTAAQQGTFAHLPPALKLLRNAWILVPLTHHNGLTGFIVLAKPRAPRSLDWEDYDLLRMIGRQVASYLEEQRAGEALIEARAFDRFNRRVAFVIHDIKNLVSQLSLMASNIERHGDNPEFRKDMMATVGDAVGRMSRLIERIRSEPEADGRCDGVRVKPLVDQVITARHHDRLEVRAEGASATMTVAADPDRLAATFAHLIDNAIEAGGEDGWIRIDLSCEPTRAVIDITDSGIGMDHTFVRDELFKPFRSTKQQGLGIGAFQCREYARELGGDVEVISSPGAGTTMRVILPLARPVQNLAWAEAGS